MIEELLAGMKGEVLGELTEKIGIPSEKVDDVLKVAGQVATKEVAKEATSGGISTIMNLFSNSENNSNANSLQDKIVTNFVSELIEKVGLEKNTADMAASYIVPLVMEKITGKNNETPENDPSPITSMFGLDGGGIMGTLGKLF